jgi:hypothetical protein
VVCCSTAGSVSHVHQCHCAMRLLMRFSCGFQYLRGGW